LSPEIDVQAQPASSSKAGEPVSQNVYIDTEVS
jgi:hypothetical protein